MVPPPLPIFEMQAVWHSWCLVFKNLSNSIPRFFFKRSWSFPRCVSTATCQASPQDLIQLVAQLPSASQEAKQQGLPRSWRQSWWCRPGVFFFFTENQQQTALNETSPKTRGVFGCYSCGSGDFKRYLNDIYIYMYAYNYIYYRIYRLSEMGKKVFHGLGNHWRQSLVSCCWESLPPRFCRCPVRPIFRKKTT